MKRIIFDADNTMGVPGCDCDDGLALIYLLAHPEECEIIGITCAYGNNTQDIVYKNTCRLVEKLGLDIPVFRGSEGADDPISDAARFLAEQAAAAPGEISVLATGSLTNLKGAAQLDSAFYRNLREVAIMGGVTGTLMVNGLVMDELNISCDAEAMMGLLEGDCPLAVATAQSCLRATCTRELFLQQVGRRSWLAQECNPWFTWMEENYNMAETIFWDVVAAAVLISSEYLDFTMYPVALNQRFLSVGYLDKATECDTPQRMVEVPYIIDPEDFRDACLDAWTLFADGAPRKEETGGAGLFAKVIKLLNL